MKAGIPTTTVIKSSVNGIVVEVCHGMISNIFRVRHFGPLLKLELPDVKVTDEEFNVWISAFRKAKPRVARFLLEDAQCN